MEDINKKAQDDEVNKAEEEIGEEPRKFISCPKIKKSKTMETQIIPKRLEIGMRVNAVCMGKNVGKYVVFKFGYDSRKIRPVAKLRLLGGEPDKVAIITERAVNEDGSVKLLKRCEGHEIQCTEYFVENEK